MKLSIAIISKTEDIDTLVLQSADFADEIVVVIDSPTIKAKKSGKVSFYSRQLNNDYASQRNFALEKTKNDWVLFIDSDEYISTELRREIQAIISKTKFSGFKIHRVDVCFHQPLLHGETGKTKLLRLAKRKSGKFIRPVHETWKINGEVGELYSPLYHIKDNFVSEFIGRTTRYSEIDSDILTRENKPFSYWRLFLNPFGKFIQNYFYRQGFLDGTAGLFSAYLMSVQSLTVRIFQWTKRN